MTFQVTCERIVHNRKRSALDDVDGTPASRRNENLSEWHQNREKRLRLWRENTMFKRIDNLINFDRLLLD